MLYLKNVAIAIIWLNLAVTFTFTLRLHMILHPCDAVCELHSFSHWTTTDTCSQLQSLTNKGVPALPVIMLSMK